MKRVILYSASVVLLLSAVAFGWAALKARHSLNANERQWIELTNQTRVKLGRPELHVDRGLCAVALLNAERLARQGSPKIMRTTKAVYDELEAAGYKAQWYGINTDTLASPDVAVIHENMTKMLPTLSEIGADYEDVGVAIVPDATRTRYYFTMVFATRKK
jgi:uncharacterized protein YkwD